MAGVESGFPEEEERMRRGEGEQESGTRIGVCNIGGGGRGSKGRWQVRLPASSETKRSWLRNSTLDVTLSIGFFK